MNKNSRLYIGTRKGLFTFKPALSGKIPWKMDRVDFLGDPVTAVLPPDDQGRILAALNLGHFGVKLRRGSVKKTDWKDLPCPTYPPVKKSKGKADTGASLFQIWVLESGGAGFPHDVWAGTIPGGLFLSRDKGDSWELNQSLWNRKERENWMGGGYDKPGLHSIVIDPHNPRHITVAVSTGGVWQTTDRGASWSLLGKGLRAAYMPPKLQKDPKVQDVHRLVSCSAHPEHMWIQHHNGIFHSTDQAVTWKELTNVNPSAFGFAAAVHPQNPRTAWFVPAIKDECRVATGGRLVVTRTTDGGKNFKVLTRGLPQIHAYHLVYRHCLEVDSSGDHLIMGSTTGGLWTSDNQGDNWTCLSNDLPPIYCTRFGQV